MTKEELEKEAEKCAQNMLFWLGLPINEKNVKEGSSHILKLLVPRENRIAELEEQNAEAKKIIETLVDSLTIAIDDERVRELTIVKEAEQFLKEVKK